MLNEQAFFRGQMHESGTTVTGLETIIGEWLLMAKKN
jgi:hypothetical protein